MIWSGGRILPDEALAIPCTDRTFEHGLGLFETARTWGGRPCLLEAHRARMLRSARELGMPIDPAAFPDARAVADLLAAEGQAGDRMLRITATGGEPGGPGPVVWMRSGPLPPGSPVGFVWENDPWTVALDGWAVARDDATARHKMLNYWSRRTAFETARARGFHEVLSRTPDGAYWEGSRTSLFAVKGGCLLIPALDGPIVPGVMRGFVLEDASRLPGEVRDVPGISRDDLLASDEVFLANAVRGIIPVVFRENPGPFVRGPWVGSIGQRVAQRLESGEDSS
ncbi:aminotransferase class IV [Tundrisphaera sp. TA3]|uniref:aminotransferase class IV n=1 Tax=Tundrisphaera sp. TA3 TaxID=3435775 RepID=UPI003EB82BBD